MIEKRNAWDENKFREVFTKAGRIVECSWGVMGCRDRKTGEMLTALLFNDDEHEGFSYAFGFKDREMVAMLCNDLMRMANRIHKGEFGKEKSPKQI